MAFQFPSVDQATRNFVMTFGAMASFGAATQLATQQAAYFLGRSFVAYNQQALAGTNDFAFIVTIGAVQQIASVCVHKLFFDEKSEIQPQFRGPAVHAIVATCLVAGTQLALRAGWIAQALTPMGGAVFCLTSYLATKYLFGKDY